MPFALGLGANLPSRGESAVGTLGQALDCLEDLVGSLQVGPLYRSRPLAARRQRAAPPQQDYFNTVAVGRTVLSPDAVLALAKGLELAAGRALVARPGERDGPRPLDIDLLLYGDTVSQRRELRLPHPRLLERRFALAPLAAIAPHWPVPPGGDSVSHHLAALGEEQWLVEIPWPDAGPRPS
ncbi:MAG: 2-amino-4-hydroxy-6-hydroxymethyldihydropteridine diphosphokinase [Acidobacteriota bacterium]